MDIQLPDRYRLHSNPLLGEGGMGRVLYVQDVILNCPVALKIVRPDLAADERFRRLFDLEVKVSARFAHPNIVPLHDLGSLGDGTPFLGLAFADAGSFANFREESDWNWADLCRLTVELLDALAHLHARGVLHRDLKPENVLLHNGDDGLRHVWLADLGLAKASSTLAKKRGRMEGTPGFMAPEQKRGEPREFGPWTDLYSVGVILWDLVTGELPFGKEHTADEKELGPFNPKLAVPDGLELVLANLLNAEPFARYDLAADLKSELLSLKHSSAAEGQRSGTVGPAYQTVRDEAATADASSLAPRWNRPLPFALPERVPSDPVRVVTARASIPLFAVRELPVVARDEYRQRIWEEAIRVHEEGTPRVVIVSGETGCGKSSLVKSVVRVLEEGGWGQTITMRFNSPPGAEDGYVGAARALIRPWNETRESLTKRLTRHLGRSVGVASEEVLEEAATLARWAGILQDDEEPIALGYGLREVHRQLDSLAWRGLSVLYMDDAQWAKEEGDGLAIAEAVLQSVSTSGSRRLLVIATVNDQDIFRDPELKSTLDSLVSNGATWIRLPRLDLAGTKSLLEASLNLSPELVERVASRCEGNPLFARQLLVDWAERGWLVDQGGLQFGLAGGVNVDSIIPDDARALFRSQVEANIENCEHPRRFKDALHLSALAGFVQPRGLWEALAGPHLQDYFEGCRFWQRNDETVNFDHGLLYQVVLEQAEDRKDVSYLHKRLSRAYRKFGEATGRDMSFRVGRHACLAGAWSDAGPCLLSASEAAWRRGRTNELAEASRLAVQACSMDDGLRLSYGKAVLWFARSLEVQGEANAAGPQYERAYGLCQEAGDQVGSVEALIGRGWATLQSGDLDSAMTFYSDAMKAAKAFNDLRLEARAIQGMAWIEQKKRNFGGADILFTRVLNRAHQLSDERAAAEATLGQAYVARQTGAFDDAEELYVDAIESYREVEDPVGIARGLYGCASVLRQQGRLEEAETLLHESIRITEDLGLTSDIMEGRLGLAEVYRARGELAKARPIYERHLGWATREGNFEGAIFANLGLSMCALHEKNVSVIHDYAQKAAAALDKVPGHWLWATYRLLVASMLALQEDERQTYQWLWSASELGLRDIADVDVASNLQLLVEVGTEKGWTDVVRLAGKLCVEQYERLSLREPLAVVRARLKESNLSM